ncbi:MAG TPA: cytochrome d ubiquinol oxidase subunit II [Gemmatimonadaceae bacterium]|jgi:cytochrome bd ubiquinol oxidase subunit II|nr:cytochrome d ubiquinol oxidase subunit II [Gemmatimonadaceae bacterium]
MTSWFGQIGLPEVIAALIVLALNAYALTGGADYGGGVWDLLASGERRREQRELIANSIAPIWEANHVWLIVAVVMLFTAFPSAFGTLGVVLHIPLTLLLIGIVLRGSAFVFRSYGSDERVPARRWGMAFAIASVVTPLLLGIVIGTVASGAAGRASEQIGKAGFTDVFVWPWLAPFPIAVGLFALALFAYLAAVYLTLDARTQPALREDFRRRALGAALIVFVLAAVALVLAMRAAPRLASGVVTAPWSLLLHLCTGVAAIFALAALWLRRFRMARIATAAQVTLILWGWALAQYPFVVPTTLPIRQAAAPRITLELLVIGLAGGAVILVPSLRYLFRTFKGESHTTR